MLYCLNANPGWGGGEGGAGHEFVHYGIGNKRSERQKEETDICKIRKFGVD